LQNLILKSPRINIITNFNRNVPLNCSMSEQVRKLEAIFK
jgi:hypothetical protein